MSDAHRDEIVKLESLYAQNPEGRIFTHLAEAYRKAGQLERAREVLTGGIERHPDYSSAHVVLGRVLVDLGQHDEARAEFRRVLELDGQNLVALRSLGDIARVEGREDEALMYYRRLADQEPSDDEVQEIIDEMTSLAPGPEEEAPAPEEEPAADAPAPEEWDPAASAGPGEAPETETAGEPEGAPPYEEPAEAQPSYGPSAYDEELPGSTAHEEPVEEPLYGADDDDVPDGAPSHEAPSHEAPGYEAGYEEPGEEDGTDGSHETSYEPSSFETEADEAGTDESPAPWEPESATEPEEATDEAEPWAVAGDLGDEWTTGGGEEEVGYEVGEGADTGWPFEESDEVETEPEPEEPEDADVMTETIAQVYARQGLYDRAVEVYQGLIRARPDDEGLRERLAEIEAQATAEAEAEAGAAGTAAEDAEAAAEDAEAGVADAEAVEEPQTWAGEYGREADDWDTGLELEPEFMAAEDEERELDVEPVGEELEPDAEEHPAGFEAAELTTAPTEGVTPLEGLESEELEPDTGLVTTPDEESAGEAEVEGGAGAGAGAPEEPTPWEIPEEALDDALAEADEASEGLEAGAHESPWIEEEWSGDQEAETPYAWAESGEATEDDSPPIHDYLKGLLRWGGGAASPAAGGGAEAGAPSGDTPEAAAPGPEGDPDGGDDDDLEMFRSWLESLKE